MLACSLPAAKDCGICCMTHIILDHGEVEESCVGQNPNCVVFACVYACVCVCVCAHMCYRLHVVRVYMSACLCSCAHNHCGPLWGCFLYLIPSLGASYIKQR